MNHLKVRLCLIDGEVVCYERGPTFQFLRHRRNEPQAFLLLELKRDGPAARADRGAQDDLGEHPAQEPAGVRLNEHMEHPEAAVVFQHACKMGLEGLVSKRLGSRYRSGRCPDWLKFKNPAAPAVKREAGLGTMIIPRRHRCAAKQSGASKRGADAAYHDG